MALCGVSPLVIFCKEGSQEIFVYCSKCRSADNIQKWSSEVSLVIPQMYYEAQLAQPTPATITWLKQCRWTWPELVKTSSFFHSVFADTIIECEKPKGVWKNRMPAEAGILFFETPTVVFFPGDTWYHGKKMKKIKNEQQSLHHVKPSGVGFTGFGPMLGSTSGALILVKPAPLGFTLHIETL